MRRGRRRRCHQRNDPKKLNASLNSRYLGGYFLSLAEMQYCTDSPVVPCLLGCVCTWNAELDRLNACVQRVRACRKALEGEENHEVEDE